MSRDAWWKAETPQRLARASGPAGGVWGVKAGDSFLIVTEGTVTEPTYLKFLRRDLQLSTVSIKIISGKTSDPFHVINSASRAAKDQLQKAKRGDLGNTEPIKFDHVWAVIDTDVAVRNSCWDKVETLAKSCKVKLAYSSPCFEYWLLLHFEYTTKSLKDGHAAKTALKHKLDGEYSTKEKDATKAMEQLIPNWPQAVINGERVRKHHQKVLTPMPANPSTEVCTLARALNESAPAHLRKPLPPPITHDLP
ncbi:MAG: RloB family protein [Verrucomicrobiota bacterium]